MVYECSEQDICEYAIIAGSVRQQAQNCNSQPGQIISLMIIASAHQNAMHRKADRPYFELPRKQRLSMDLTVSIRDIECLSFRLLANCCTSERPHVIKFVFSRRPCSVRRSRAAQYIEARFSQPIWRCSTTSHAFKCCSSHKLALSSLGVAYHPRFDVFEVRCLGKISESGELICSNMHYGT